MDERRQSLEDQRITSLRLGLHCLSALFSDKAVRQIHDGPPGSTAARRLRAEFARPQQGATCRDLPQRERRGQIRMGPPARHRDLVQ